MSAGPTLGEAIDRGIGGRCPSCGEGKLFAGFLRLAPRCAACGLDYGFADSGDGPAVFVMLIGSAIVLGTGLLMDIAWEPPIWVHVVVLVPLALIVCLGLLRPLKGMLIAQQYRVQAEEGRFEK